MKLSSIGLMGLPTLSIAIAMPGLAVVDSSVNSNFSVRNTAHSNKRGLSYNDAGLTHLFSGSKVAWMYNWAQRSGGGDSSYEYIPMLHHEEDVCMYLQSRRPPQKLANCKPQNSHKKLVSQCRQSPRIWLKPHFQLERARPVWVGIFIPNSLVSKSRVEIF